MSDLGRMLEDGGEDAFLRDALDSARDDVPDAARRAATLSALSPDAIAKPAKNGVNATLPPAPNEAPANGPANATTAAASGATLKWVVIIGLAVGAVAVGLYAQSGGETTTRTPTTQPSIASPTAAAPTPSPSAALTPAEAVTAVASAPASGADSAPKLDVAPKASAAPKEARSAAPPPLGLAEETAILDRARGALNRADARGALAELDRYDAAPGPKILGQEATMVRIEALTAKGDTAAARALARSFLAKNPGSTYDDRVRALIAEPKTP